MRKRLERLGNSAQLLIDQTLDFEIRGVLAHGEIAQNGLTAYTLHRSNIRPGQHLHLLVLEDLLQMDRDTTLCLSLSNHRIAGRAQIPAHYLMMNDLPPELSDDDFFVLGRLLTD